MKHDHRSSFFVYRVFSNSAEFQETVWQLVPNIKAQHLLWTRLEMRERESERDRERARRRFHLSAHTHIEGHRVWCEFSFGVDSIAIVSHLHRFDSFSPPTNRINFAAHQLILADHRLSVVIAE